MKSRYKFQIRPLIDEPVLLGFELEAGPFTPEEAERFGDLETDKCVANTGKQWVYRWEMIPDPPPSRFPLRGLLIIVGCVLLGYLIGCLLVGMWPL